MPLVLSLSDVLGHAFDGHGCLPGFELTWWRCRDDQLLCGPGAKHKDASEPELRLLARLGDFPRCGDGEA
ncbi:hypothetical protein RA210_U280020 [Rubrivivax sp. A210]|nr:hypothetical protein RA210_U280020 [Rubrivivax sp. A210]